MFNTTALIPIGRLARLTGVREATIRAWERRHGYPVPQRNGAGRRRYTPEDVDRIRRVVAQRDAGVALGTAIERVLSAPPGPPSLFARLRAARPDLQPAPVRKRNLIHLSRAVEEESAAHGKRTLLVGSFQRERFYRQSERRWRELAAGADVALVLADFERANRRARPAEVPLGRTDPAAREWAVISTGPGHAICLVAWEPPGRPKRADGRREFEVLWSVEPEVVSAAVQVIVAIVDSAEPDLAAGTREEFDAVPVITADAQLRMAASVSARLIASLP